MNEQGRAPAPSDTSLRWQLFAQHYLGWHRWLDIEECQGCALDRGELVGIMLIIPRMEGRATWPPR